MLRVMIVDDENIVIESITYIIQKNFEDVAVAGTARSGREAIEKAEMIKPDLVFMDIKMPGINGIDAIKEIKAMLPQAQFVVLSACEQFEYAKEAVNLGVSEYLMKPVNRLRMIEIIRNARRIQEESRERRKRELELKEKFEKVLPVLEHGLIYAILLYEDYNEEIENYKRILELSDDKGYIITFEFGEGTDSGNVIGTSVLSQSFYPQLRDIIKERFRCAVGPAMLNRVIVYVPVPPTRDDYAERIEAVEASEAILERIAGKIKANVRIGIGAIKSGEENLLGSFSESLRAIKHAREKEIVHIHDIPEENMAAPNPVNMREKMLMEKASSGDTGESLALFSQICNDMMAAFGNSVEEMKGRLLELVVMLHRLGLDYGIEEKDTQNYLMTFLSLNEPLLMKNWCKSRIETITAGIKAARQNRCHHLINTAKAFIEARFHEDITLEDISREVNLSPQYFSRFFKEETGENFIDYLTQVRIQKAINLLHNKNLSVKEISFQVGYNDPNYFSRIFKKITGYTPSDYKI